jgi:succinate-semialdehyde dehydrogenase / glutarate-semialdehyde dehydrogenase
LKTLQSMNPTTGGVIASYPEMEDAAVDAMLQEAQEAAVAWRQLSGEVRAKHLRQVAAALRGHQMDYARLMALEMGKPVCQGRAEIEKCAWTCDYFADHAALWLEPELIRTEAQKSYVCYQPLGVVLAVMPWNFPFWQVFRFLAPALMAGNGCVLKHASNVSGCALAMGELVRQAGLPPGLFQVLLLRSARVERVIRHPVVQAVTLTGSTPAGRSVAAIAGSCLKKTVLELGGSDPYVVLEDADIEHAAAICAKARLLNGGQSCIAAKRFIVVRSLLDRFERSCADRMRQVKMGDPLDETTEIGPLARHDLRDELHDQVQRTLALGARLLLGGQAQPGPGAFYPPTLLSDVPWASPAAQEELFGPVGAILPVNDEKEAVLRANDTPFGLGAAVFTRDLERGERVAARIEAGCCFVNDFVRSDARLPFGGIKESGYGRELSSFGIREFVNIKTVYLKS